MKKLIILAFAAALAVGYRAVRNVNLPFTGKAKSANGKTTTAHDAGRKPKTPRKARAKKRGSTSDAASAA